MFELKLARFGYRYKFDDGEYSSFSPWSEIAFLPSKFEYDSSVGYNLGMVNNLRELTIKDFIPYNIPLDVKEVEILYKTTDSANIYVVDNIKRGDTNWEVQTPDGARNNRYIKTGKLTITSEMVHRVLPENQALRSWDNVPRKALSQEITGNRLVYGNYVQGYDINESIGLNQYLRSEKNGNYSSNDIISKSVKTDRDYKIGMVFGDKYGRETPVITSSYSNISNIDDDFESITGDISIPKKLSGHQNNLVVTQNWGSIDENNTPPTGDDGWIDYVKYYVKETSGEYYNLVMNRWYDSGDGKSVWLSFNSADRNKVDEDTYLILKNNHGSDEPVLERARYKIIAIENEAPEYIKTDRIVIGKIKELNTVNTGISFWDHYVDHVIGDDGEADVNNNSPVSAYTTTEFFVTLAKWNKGGMGNLKYSSSNDEITGDIFGEKPKDKIEVRVVGEISGLAEKLYSPWRKVVHYGTALYDYVDGNGASGSDIKAVKFVINKRWTEDEVFMFKRFNTLYNGGANANYNPGTNGKDVIYSFEFREAITENKPEFDGRFFVKIKKDLTIQQSVQTGFNNEWVQNGVYYTHYIESSYKNKTQMNEPNQVNSTTGEAVALEVLDFGGSPCDTEGAVCSETWFGGAFASFIQGGENSPELFDNAGINTRSPSGNGMAYSTCGSGYLEDLGCMEGGDLFEFGCEWGNAADCFNYIYNGYFNHWPIFGEDAGYSAEEAIEGDFGLSPFGSLSWNYARLSWYFWNGTFWNGSQNGPGTAWSFNFGGDATGTSQGPPLITTGNQTVNPITKGYQVFLDSCGMSRMNIFPGPERNTDIDPGDLDEFGAPDMLSSNTHEAQTRWWLKPKDVFSPGNAVVNGVRGATNGTVGSMAMSYNGSWGEVNEPLFFKIIREPGTFFRWIDDPDPNNIYISMGCLYKSNPKYGPSLSTWHSDHGGYWSHQYNVPGNITSNTVFGAVNSGSAQWPKDNTQHLWEKWIRHPYGSGWNLRHTQWVEFRKVNTITGEITTDGMNLGDFDPRSFMHHDGRDAVAIEILKLTSSFEEDTVLGDSDKGACWETEPNESVEVDIYYEASNAIPMFL